MLLVLELLVDVERYQSLNDQQFIRQPLRKEWVQVESDTGWFLEEVNGVDRPNSRFHL